MMSALRKGLGVVVMAFCALANAPLAARAETLRLEDCLREAAENNPEIDRQRRDFERALGTRLVYRSRAFPQLNVGGLVGQQGKQQDEVIVTKTRDAQGRQVETTTVTARPSKFFSFATGNGSQALFDYAIPPSFRRGDIEVRIAAQNFYVTAATVLHTTRLQFYQALFQRDSEALLREIGARLTQNERNQRASFAAGVASQLAPLQAQLQVYNLQAPTIAAGGSYRTALVALLQLMGRDLGPDGAATRTTDPRTVHLAGNLEAGTNFTFDPAAATRLALRERPDLQLLRELRAAALEDTDISNGGYLPLARLVADGTFVPQDAVRTDRNAIRPNDQIRTTEVRYGASFTWTIIDTGAVTGAVRNFRALGQIFDVRLRDAEATAARDAARLRIALSGADARRETLRRSRREATDVMNAIERAVSGGTATQTDFLFAQTDLLSNRAGLLAAALAQQTVRAEYDRLTGAYLRFVRETPSAPAAK